MDNSMTTLTARTAARSSMGLIMFAAVLWGTVGVTTQAIYQISTTNPISIGFFRLALATPILLLAAWLLPAHSAGRLTRRDLLAMALIGVMLAFYQVCFFAAIARIGVAIATLITLCSAPVLVALLGAIFMRERLTPAVLLALVCAVVGVALMVQIQPETGQSTDLIGILLALGSGFGYAVMALAGRTVAGHAHPIQTSAVSFACGALALLPIALATGFAVDYPAQGWLLLGYLGLVPSALAYMAFLAGMRSTPATIASIITLLEPLTATVLAWVLFGEQLGPSGLLGACFLLGAIGILYRSQA
jgi:DME family drug/metabolite transporter